LGEREKEEEEEEEEVKEEEREGEFSAAQARGDLSIAAIMARNRRVFAPRACRNSRVSRGTLKRLFNIRRVCGRALVRGSSRECSSGVVSVRAKKYVYSLRQLHATTCRPRGMAGRGAYSARTCLCVSKYAGPYVRIFSNRLELIFA